MRKTSRFISLFLKVNFPHQDHSQQDSFIHYYYVLYVCAGRRDKSKNVD